MKKTLILATLALASLAASAVEVTGTVKYDYDRFENTPTWLSQHNVVVGAKVGFGAAGAVDAGFVTNQIVTGTRSNQVGYELGYSNGLKIGSLGLSGRIAYRHQDLNNAATAGSIVGVAFANAIDGSLNQTRYSVEVTYPLSSTVTGFVGGEHISTRTSGRLLALATDGEVVVAAVVQGAVDTSANRFTVGADFVLSKNLSLRAGYAYAKSEGYRSNGLTTAVSYKF